MEADKKKKPKEKRRRDDFVRTKGTAWMKEAKRQAGVESSRGNSTLIMIIFYPEFYFFRIGLNVAKRLKKPMNSELFFPDCQIHRTDCAPS